MSYLLKHAHCLLELVFRDCDSLGRLWLLAFAFALCWGQEHVVAPDPEKVPCMLVPWPITYHVDQPYSHTALRQRREGKEGSLGHFAYNGQVISLCITVCYSLNQCLFPRNYNGDGLTFMLLNMFKQQ